MQTWSSVGKGCLFFLSVQGLLPFPEIHKGGLVAVEEEWMWLIVEISPTYVIYVGTGLCTTPARLCWAAHEPEQGCVVLEPAWMSLKLPGSQDAPLVVASCGSPLRTASWVLQSALQGAGGAASRLGQQEARTRSPQSWDPAWAKRKSLLTSCELLGGFSCSGR